MTNVYDKLSTQSCWGLQPSDFHTTSFQEDAGSEKIRIGREILKIVRVSSISTAAKTIEHLKPGPVGVD